MLYLFSFELAFLFSESIFKRRNKDHFYKRVLLIIIILREADMQSVKVFKCVFWLSTYT